MKILPLSLHLPADGGSFVQLLQIQLLKKGSIQLVRRIPGLWELQDPKLIRKDFVFSRF